VNFLKKILKKETPEKTLKAAARAQSMQKVSIKFPTLAVHTPARNISVTGVAVDIAPELNPLNLGLKIAVVMQVLDKTFHLDLKVVRKNEFIIAFSFLNPLPELIHEISRVFMLEFNAKNIQYIDATKLKPDPRGRPHWFYGGENYELYYIEDNDVIKLFHLKILSDVIEKKFEGPIVFGRIWSEGPLEQESDLPKYKGPDLIEPQKNLPPEVLKNATNFLSHVAKLPSNHHEQILEYLKTSL
jgi:hypothetical protein